MTPAARPAGTATEVGDGTKLNQAFKAAKAVAKAPKVPENELVMMGNIPMMERAR